MSDRPQDHGGSRDEPFARDRDDRREQAGDREHRTWAEDDDNRDHRGRGQDSPYGRLSSGVSTGSGYASGGYGGQGGFGEQDGQGGYASPAQGSRYGRTGSEWGRSGYGSFSSEGSGQGRSYGGGQASGFGATSYAAERDDHAQRGGGQKRDYGFRGQGGGGAQWGGPGGRGEGGYGSSNPDRSAQRSRYRQTSDYDASHEDPRGRAGASGRDDDDHEPHYRTWREQQLAGHDRDYDRWRAAQAQRYDEDYRRYRDQRHEGFSRDFGDWRNQAGGRKEGQPSTASSAVPATGAAATQDQNQSPSQGGAGSLIASDDSLRSVTEGHPGKTPDADRKDEGDGKAAS